MAAYDALLKLFRSADAARLGCTAMTSPTAMAAGARACNPFAWPAVVVTSCAWRAIVVPSR